MTAAAPALVDHRRFDFPQEEVYDIASLGEGITLTNRRTMEFDLDAAANFLNRYAEFWVNDSKVDRKLDDQHVIHLAREMLAGNFRWEHVNLVVAKVDGVEYRLNGQHTAWARILADEEGLDKKTRTPVQLMRYECATIQDARRLYASLDRGKGRGQNTVVQSHLLGSEEFAGFRAGQLNMLSQGLAAWLWPSKTKRELHKGDDRAYLLLKDHYRLAQAVGGLIKQSKAADFKHMKRAPVVAAMFETFNKAPQVAYDFWMSVRDGIGIGDKEDPRWVLREWLKNTSLGKSVTIGDLKVVTQEETYRACIHAWNAHRTNKRLKHLRVSVTEDRPNAR